MTAALPGLLSVDKKLALPTIKMLARAFSNYPLLIHYFPSESNRQTIIENMLALPVYTCLRYGEIYATSPKLEGAAIWAPSENYPVSFWRLLRTLPLRYIFEGVSSSAARLQAADRFINSIHFRLVPYHHFYLEVLGVDPAYQKQGFSSKLIRPMLERLDSAELPCYLETQDPRNVLIYQHLGFKIIDESPIPDTPLKSWGMLHKPGGKNNTDTTNPPQADQ